MSVVGSADKFIYITGCDSGFGAILTRKLDALGFGVIPGCFLEKSLDVIRKECSSRVHPIRVDVSDESSVKAAAEEISRIVEGANGKLHGLVNNAGILVQPGPFEWTPVDAYRRMFNVNVMGTVMTTKYLMPLLRKSQGRVVNVASIAGRVGLPTQPAYCMSKYAVEGFCEVLRKDLTPWGVTLHIIEPGVFKATNLYATFEAGLDKMYQDLPPAIEKAYGENFYKMTKKMMVDGMKIGSTDSGQVPIAMIDALTSAKPKYRYRVGLDSKYGITVIEKCHESVQDALLRAVDRKNPVFPAESSKSRFEAAMARYNKDWPRFLIILALIAVVLSRLRLRS